MHEGPPESAQVQKKAADDTHMTYPQIHLWVYLQIYLQLQMYLPVSADMSADVSEDISAEISSDTSADISADTSAYKCIYIYIYMQIYQHIYWQIYVYKVPVYGSVQSVRGLIGHKAIHICGDFFYVYVSVLKVCL